MRQNHIPIDRAKLPNDSERPPCCLPDERDCLSTLPGARKLRVMRRRGEDNSAMRLRLEGYGWEVLGFDSRGQPFGCPYAVAIVRRSCTPVQP